LIDDIEPIADYLDLDTSDPIEQKLMEELANRVTDLFESVCKRQFISATHTEYHDGTGNLYLFPFQYPITSVTSIHDDPDWSWGAATLISASDYMIHQNARMIVLKSGYFADDVQNIKIVYVAGYAASAVPKDLINALVEQVGWLYKKKKHHLLGVASRALPDGTLAFNQQDLLPEVKIVLKRHTARFA
jgi:hypothetical protein